MNEPTNSASEGKSTPEPNDLDRSEFDPETQEFVKMMEA